MPAALVKVQHPPPRPLLLWDGDCGFCGRCARWMQRQTGDQVDYQPYQRALARFPELDENALERAVHLVEPNGRVTHSAEAVYRAVECVRGWSWLICAYVRLGAFAALSEWGYRRVANNRSFISWLTRSRPKG